MNQCPKCFAPLDPAAGFCTHCGYSPEYAPPSSLIQAAAVAGSGRFGTGGQTPNRELMQQARDALRGKWEVAFGATVLYWAVLMAGNLVPIIGSVAAIVIYGPMMVGLSLFFLTVARNEKRPEVEILFKGFSQFGTSLGAYFLMTLIVTVGFIFLIIPGIVFWYGFYQVFYILADHPDMGVTDAFTKSWNLMSGYKWKLFCLHCRFIGWTLLCLLTFGLGFALLVPYMNTATARFYDDLATN